MGLDKTTHSPSSSSGHSPRRRPSPGRRHPPGAPRALLPLPLASCSDYNSKHWTAAPAREGVVWKSFKDSVTLGVDAQKPGPLPWWGGECGDARGVRPSKAQAGVWLRASGEEMSRLVGFLEDICHSSRSRERPPPIPRIVVGPRGCSLRGSGPGFRLWGSGRPLSPWLAAGDIA